MSNNMRELGGLVDNLYISSQQQREKSRHPSDLPGMMSKAAPAMGATPSRARKVKVSQPAKMLGEAKRREAQGKIGDKPCFRKAWLVYVCGCGTGTGAFSVLLRPCILSAVCHLHRLNPPALPFQYEGPRPIDKHRGWWLSRQTNPALKYRLAALRALALAGAYLIVCAQKDARVG